MTTGETRAAAPVSSDTLFDTPPEPEFDRLTDLAATLLGVPVALLSLVDDKRQFFKSMKGLTGWAAEARETPLSHSFCQHVVARGKALVVEDARLLPLVRQNKAVEDLGVIAYLGEPVHKVDGTPLGALCAIDGTPRNWSDSDRAVLRTLAGAVDAEIALRETLAGQRALIATLSETNAALEAARADAESARSQAELALAERTRLFTALGHEFRTPMNGILGGLALLETTDDTEKREQFSKMIRDSSDTLMKFIDNVVGYARASAGSILPSVEPFSPDEPVDAAIRTCAAYAEVKGLRLQAVPMSPDAERCLGDAELVAQILINLVGNAIKYTDAGSVTVGVHQSAAQTVWRVSDTGPGVPPALREQIFEPFDRGDPAVADGAGGSGLGLSVARLTAKAIGAVLTLEDSDPGHGAVFALSLPRKVQV